MPDALDILAIAAHRDDVEQTCGGTLLRMAQQGRRTGILDLTRGELGTRGSAKQRGEEALSAAKILQASWREALDIPDGRVENTWGNKLKIARVIREQRPRVLILPYWQARHPDHSTCSVLAYEACFIAGLSKLDVSAYPVFHDVQHDVLLAAPQDPGFAATNPKGSEASLAAHRPFKIIYASLYHDVRPTFVVDITEQFESRLDSLFAYRSQYDDQQAGSELFPQKQEVRERIEAMARFYGLLAGVKYAEPFVQKEVGLVDDLLMIPVKSL